MFGFGKRKIVRASASTFDELAICLQFPHGGESMDLPAITLVRIPEPTAAPVADDPIARHKARVLAKAHPCG